MLVVLRPKAVMISQDNITWMIQVEVLKSSNLRSIVWYLNEKVAQEVHQWRWKEEVWVSYLPLSHVAAQVVVFVFSIHPGICILYLPWHLYLYSFAVKCLPLSHVAAQVFVFVFSIHPGICIRI